MTEEIGDPELSEENAPVELGINPEQALAIVAQERWQMATSALRLQERLRAMSATVAVNKAAASPDLKQWEEKERQLGADLKHVMRAIRLIDKQYPRALAKMQELQGTA